MAAATKRPGPWLSRPMREELGLTPPERRIGLAAHDFAQALGAREVYLTRAHKVDGVPTVPSRWLQRLLALIKAAGLEQAIEPEQPWVQWARERDHAPTFEPVEAPEPRPPLEARPTQLSVTRIERWIANPYEIFAATCSEAREDEGARRRAGRLARAARSFTRVARFLPRLSGLPAGGHRSRR